jgi:hypothetical protein
MPTLESTQDGRCLEPMEFKENSNLGFASCLKGVREKWGTDSEVRQNWDKWAKEICPNDMTALEYIKDHRYNEPLKEFFYEGIVNDPHWSADLKKTTYNNEGLDWPAAISICMPSVTTSFDRNPGPSRIYSSMNDVLKRTLDTFSIKSEIYYNHLLQIENNILQNILKRRVDMRGEGLKHTGQKSTLIDRIKQSDKIYFTISVRQMSPENFYFVQGLFSKNFSTEVAYPSCSYLPLFCKVIISHSVLYFKSCIQNHYI